MKKIFYLLAAIFFFTLPVSAYSATVAIEPSHFEIKGKPGNNINGTFKFSADTGSTYQFSIRQFEADGTKGQIRLLPENPNYPVSKWVQFFPPQTTVKSPDDQTIGFRINVPETINEQDFYFAILASPLQPSNSEIKSSQATVLPAVATNVILSLFDKSKVEGDIKVSLSGQKVQNLDQATLELTVQNNLNKFQTLEGSVELTSLITSQTQNIPIIPQNILAGAIREMTSSLDPKTNPSIYIEAQQPGIYRAKATVAGDTGTKYTSPEITIFILPSLEYLAYPLITIFLLIAAAILSFKVFKKTKNT